MVMNPQCVVASDGTLLDVLRPVGEPDRVVLTPILCQSDDGSLLDTQVEVWTLNAFEEALANGGLLGFDRADAGVVRNYLRPRTFGGGFDFKRIGIR
jgi:hypothetical protein